MTEEKDNIVREPETGDPKPAVPGLQQKKKTAVAFLIMLVPFCAFMYMLFADGKKTVAEDTDGLNVEVPDGRGENIQQNKEKAQEQVQRSNGRVRSFDDDFFGFFSGGDDKPPATPESGDDLYAPQPERAVGNVRQSQRAYQDVTRQMNDFYNTPARDPALDEMQRELEKLRAQLEAKEAATAAVPDPLEIMERSYELAAKYFATEEPAPEPIKSSGRDKAVVSHARPPGPVVSALPRAIPDTALAELMAAERNFGFNTPVGGETRNVGRNAIRACVDADQTVTTGGAVKLRLQESIILDNQVIPSGTILTATTRLSGQRLDVMVTSIEHGGSILNVDLTAYDTDGQRGLYVPDSKERTALKEAAASVGAGLGQSISIARNAGQQVAMDLTRGITAGGSQYLSSKLKEVKLNLKANYQILLLPKQ